MSNHIIYPPCLTQTQEDISGESLEGVGWAPVELVVLCWRVFFLDIVNVENSMNSSFKPMTQEDISGESLEGVDWFPVEWNFICQYCVNTREKA